MISFSSDLSAYKNQSDLLIPSRDKPDQRILQPNYLTAFPPAIQVHFFQSWGVYRKRDDKINFYLKTFSTKIKTKLCKIVEKSNFWVIFDRCLSLCPKLFFFGKKSDSFMHNPWWMANIILCFIKIQWVNST